MADTTFVGLDGCRGGWIMACWHVEPQKMSFHLLAKLSVAVATFQQAHTVWIDMPIGLSGNGIERIVDYQLREQLRWRRSSVFFPPSYEALMRSSYEEANAVHRKLYGKGLSRQAWNLRKKILELHELLLCQPKLRAKFVESHPELVFQQYWHREIPMASKSSHLGYLQRMDILKRFCANIDASIRLFAEQSPASLCKKDDILDAAVLAFRAAAGHERTIEQTPRNDHYGLPFQVVY